MTEHAHHQPPKATKEEKKEAAEIVQRLQESGEYKRLQEKLLTEILDKHPEWWDVMRSKTRTLAQTNQGISFLNLTMDELAAELIPAGKNAVPSELKEAFLAQYIPNSIRKPSTQR